MRKSEEYFEAKEDERIRKIYLNQILKKHVFKVLWHLIWVLKYLVLVDFLKKSLHFISKITNSRWIIKESEWEDLNLRLLGPEPSALPPEPHPDLTRINWFLSTTLYIINYSIKNLKNIFILKNKILQLLDNLLIIK